MRRKRALTDDELYLGPVGAKLDAIRRARQDADDFEADPLTPCVVLDRVGDDYTAYIDPPLPSGDHRVVVHDKDAGWRVARELWSRFGLGLRDLSNPNIGRWSGNE